VGRLLPQHLGLPDYFPANAPSAGIVVLHADAEHPCIFKEENGTAAVPDECVAPAGRLLLAAMRSNVANYVVVASGTCNYNFPLLSALQDCFGSTTNNSHRNNRYQCDPDMDRCRRPIQSYFADGAGLINTWNGKRTV